MKHSPTTNRLILVLCAVMFAVAALAAQMAILSELPTIATSLQEGAHRISERARHAVAQLASPVQSIGPDTRQEQVPVQAPFIPVASSPEREVRAAWKRAQQADSYHFTADIKQTVVPKSTIFNVGRTNDRMSGRAITHLDFPPHITSFLSGFPNSPSTTRGFLQQILLLFRDNLPLRGGFCSKCNCPECQAEI